MVQDYIQATTEDTIVALATHEGEAGLAVVRLSGADAVEVANKVFQSPDFGPAPRSHYAVYGILTTATNKDTTSCIPIDQVIALPMLAPRSYTGEDTVEFFCHGGRIVARQIVSACRSAGARPATAGEFTRRAFLNGKLSLDQAEAVADLIHSESRHAARAAMGQLLGGLDRQLTAIEKPLLELLGNIEGSLEFLEEENAGISLAEISNILQQSVGQIDELLLLAPAGRLLRDGVQVVLAGPTNSGKSSLFNQLLGEDRALVDNEAGTTRDVVSGSTEYKGTRFVFHDTAGLREQAGRVEKMGIDRTLQAMAKADVILSIFENDSGNTALVGVDPGTPVIPVKTKADLGGNPDLSEEAIWTSSLDGRGLPELWESLLATADSFHISEAITLGVVINERHRHKLEQCRADLVELLHGAEESHQSGKEGPGPEVIGTMLSSILGQFGEISGRVFSEQLLEHIFNRFCVGK